MLDHAPQKNQPKRFLLFCEPCAFKQIFETDQPDTLTMMKVSDVPGGAPQLDPKTNKAVAKPVTKANPKAKCPKCGRGVVLKKLPDVYVKSFSEIDSRRQKEKDDFERAQRIKDGQPPQKPDVEFTG